MISKKCALLFVLLSNSYSLLPQSRGSTAQVAVASIATMIQSIIALCLNIHDRPNIIAQSANMINSIAIIAHEGLKDDQRRSLITAEALALKLRSMGIERELTQWIINHQEELAQKLAQKI